MPITLYRTPEEVKVPVPDYKDYDMAAEQAKEAKFFADLKAHLISTGWTGPNTGKIYRSQIADGYAQYMVIDPPKGSKGKFGVIHLPLGDGYRDRDVSFLTKTEILRRIKGEEALQALFK